MVWLILYNPVNNFSVLPGWVCLGWTSTKQGLMCLAQGHIAVKPVRLEPATPRSLVKHSTTELPTIFSHIRIPPREREREKKNGIDYNVRPTFMIDLTPHPNMPRLSKYHSTNRPKYDKAISLKAAVESAPPNHPHCLASCQVKSIQLVYGSALARICSLDLNYVHYIRWYCRKLPDIDLNLSHYLLFATK